MGKLSVTRLEKIEKISRQRREQAAEREAAEARTMTHTGLSDEDLAALGRMAQAYEYSLAEMCTAIIVSWLNSSD